ALIYDPAPPAEDAPTKLAAGESALFTVSGPFVVRSQDEDHPLAVYSFMTGSEFGCGGCVGGPAVSAGIPPEQFLDHYIFYVDTSYRNSHIVVVRSHEPDKAFAPVTLDCAGPLDGWQPVGVEGKYEYLYVPLVQSFSNVPVGAGVCGAGRHEMQS